MIPLFYTSNRKKIKINVFFINKFRVSVIKSDISIKNRPSTSYFYPISNFCIIYNKKKKYYLKDTTQMETIVERRLANENSSHCVQS